MKCERHWLSFLLIALVIVAFHAPISFAASPAPGTVRVMTFNLWHGGDGGGQPLEKSAEVIRVARADVVGLQETAGNAPEGTPRPDHAAKLAAMLDWNYVDQGDHTGIISRFEIVETLPKKWGVQLATPSGRKFYMFNVHLAHAPYQPYQLLNIPYNNGRFLQTETEAVEAARMARGGQIERMLAEARSVQDERLPMFLTGDFNEPCCHDWTVEVAAAGKCPLKVEWPTTKAVVDAGFVDAYRCVFPDPIAKRGLTWTPTTKETDLQDRHDRIDLIFVRDDGVWVKSAEVVGESAEYADIVVELYPSDHRAVVVEVELVRGAK